MTTKEIIEGNMIIAEFMGAERYTDEYGTWYKMFPAQMLCMHTKEGSLEYHKDWNWIMKVVENLNKLPGYDHEYLSFYLCAANIKRTWEMIVDLIKFRNSQKL